MPKFLVRITFAAGFFIGVLLGVLFLPTQKKPAKHVEPTPPANNYKTWFAQQQLKRNVLSADTLRYTGFDYFTESKYLYNNIRVLCIILVHKAKYVTASLMTWAKHCNDVQLVQLKRKKTTLKRNKEDAAWPLLCNALANASDSFHWVFVVNDDTFALLENIRYLVAPLNHSSQYYLGHGKKFWGIKYNVGQAGYLLSNGTLAALKKKIEDESCSIDSIIWNLEDYYLGKALDHLNISVGDTRDEFGLATFHGYNLQKLFFPGSTAMSNYYRFSVYPTHCCSSRSATFQVSNSNSMYTYEYILHKLQLFTSGTLGNRNPPNYIPKDEVWKALLKEHGRTNTNISAEEYYEFWVELVSDPVSFAHQIKGNN